jgi:uncharacterized membrane protein YidH (DUF202 family)
MTNNIMPKNNKRSQIENQTYLSMERTILSKERTILAFIQTGLAFIGVGIAIINVFSTIAWSVIVGSLLLVIGFVEIAESYRRLTHYQKKMGQIRTHLGKYAI